MCDLSKSFTSFTDEVILERFKVLVDNYNNDKSEENFSIMMDSCPRGLELTMGCVSNYLQLKTMYTQRKTHKYYQWRIFCDWIESLPLSEFITGKTL